MTHQYHAGATKVRLGVLVPVQVRGECGLGWGAGGKDAEGGVARGGGLEAEMLRLTVGRFDPEGEHDSALPITMWRTWGVLASGSLSSRSWVPRSNYQGTKERAALGESEPHVPTSVQA